MGRRDLPRFVRTYFAPFRGPALRAPIALAEELVLGAVEFAARLGFSPHSDFAPTRAHLGDLGASSTITFGCEGRPLYVEGPFDARLTGERRDQPRASARATSRTRSPLPVDGTRVHSRRRTRFGTGRRAAPNAVGRLPARMLARMGQLTRRFHLPSAVRPSSVRIVPGAARALVTDGAVLVDVRRQDDDTAKLDGALRITPDAIPQWIAEFKRDVPIVLACT
jgi:hypothetical protein